MIVVYATNMINENDIQKSLGFYIGYTLRILKNILTREFNNRGFKITATQWPILKMLWCRNGIPQHELSEIMEREKTTMARIIAGMEKNGWVYRDTSPGDKRVKLVYLTDKGNELREDLFAIAEEIESNIINGIKREHLKIMQDVLNDIRSNAIEKYLKD